MKHDVLIKPLARSAIPVAWCVVAVALPAAAQTLPDAGRLLQQVQPAAPLAPASAGTGLSIEGKDGNEIDDTPAGAAFLVRRIDIRGAQRFGVETLRSLVAEGEGRELTLRDVARLAARITAHYRQQGYPLTRAVVPAQTVRDGVVVVEVVEARFGRIDLNNRSAVKGNLLQETLSPLQGGADIAQAPLQRSLLLLSDVPGLTVGATLRPGAVAGGSDLEVDTSTPASHASTATVDQYGNRSTGRTRVSGSLTVFSPWGWGDAASLQALTSGAGLTYGRAAYDAVLNGQGTRMGLGFSAMSYRLGGALEALKAHGTAEVASLSLRQPWVRSPDLNVFVQAQYEQTVLRDRVDQSGLRTDRRLNNVTFSLGGDGREWLGRGSASSWNLSVLAGQVRFDDAAARQADTAAALTEGRFVKTSGGLSHRQPLGLAGELGLILTAQRASKNLDGSQKISVAGPAAVRAYDVGSVSGDSGVWLTLEYRHLLDTLQGGPLRLAAFVDAASVKLNERPWTARANRGTVAGAGLGLSWQHPSGWGSNLAIATPVGGHPDFVARPSAVRAWADVSKRF